MLGQLEMNLGDSTASIRLTGIDRNFDATPPASSSTTLASPATPTRRSSPRRTAAPGSSKRATPFGRLASASMTKVSLPALYLRPPPQRERLDWTVGVTRDARDEPFEIRNHLADGTRHVVLLDDEPLAECSVHHVTVVHTWSDGSGDHDHYAALRIESVLDEPRWRRLPWGHRGPGELFYAWNHYHDEMIRDDPEGQGWIMASWEEVERALADETCTLEYHDGARWLPPRRGS